MKKDITTKEIIQAITKELGRYILNLKIEDIKFIDKELKRIEKREADIVALCKIDDVEKILHIEIQNDNQTLIPRRMLRYYNDIKTKFEKYEVLQYLIYIGKKKLTMKDEIKEENLHFKFKIVDMHKIDCEKLIKMDTPDALVLSILCDFKDKKELDILLYITKRLEELVDDSSELGKYMLMLETLSENRDLKDKLKEVENMLRDVRLEDLPSYEIGLEKGIKKGIEKGQKEEKIAITRSLLDILDDRTISERIGLDIKEVKKIRAENKN